jgi:hypothetical protein
MVKKISASILQCIDIAMFTGGHAKARCQLKLERLLPGPGAN